MLGAPGPGGIEASTSPGAVYVFVKPTMGWASTSTFTAKLTASDGEANDELGWSVAISGNGSTVVARAPGATVGGSSGQGAVYVFVKPSTGWATATQTAKLTASDGEANDELGWSVAISGDGSTVVAGAPSFGVVSGTPAIAVYVFAEQGTAWATATQTGKLTASDGGPLGQSVAISDDGSMVVAGAPDATIGQNLEQGAVYVFVEPARGWASTSTFTAKLTVSDGAVTDFLGWSVAISSDGSTVAAGVPMLGLISPIGYSVNPGPGAVYVFVKPTMGWASTSAFTAKLTASDGEAHDALGISVAISGDGSPVAAGAAFSNSEQGAVYVFAKQGTAWATATQTAKLTASDGEAGDELSSSGGDQRRRQ